MCLGTYIVSYSCGHVLSTPDICLRHISPHYRCGGMKITQPNSRCVECFARDLAVDSNLTTTARFNPNPTSPASTPQTLTPESSFDETGRNDAIRRWCEHSPDHCLRSMRLTTLFRAMDVSIPSLEAADVERSLRRQGPSFESVLAEGVTFDLASRPSRHVCAKHLADPSGYEADDDSSVNVKRSPTGSWRASNQ